MNLSLSLSLRPAYASLIQTPFIHLPGQWLDVHIPSIPQAGGFTITSAPHHAAIPKHIELAIQRSSYNPPAAFFWRPPDDILGSPLQIRFSGRFVYPPPELSEEEAQGIKRVVFVAGGVGINPIISMLGYIHLDAQLKAGRIRSLKLLYGTRASVGEAILFYERIGRILTDTMSGNFGADAEHGHRATMYLTGRTDWSPDQIDGHESLQPGHIEHRNRRINPTDLLEALGPLHDRKTTVAYICGPPKTTDDFVEILSRAEGMEPNRVLCEKWW
jgi:ferredoxin-NADP reductase